MIEVSTRGWNARTVWLLLMGVTLLSSVGTGAAEESHSYDQKRALRRTPIVEAYERSRDSVVNLSATERIVLDMFPRRRGLFLMPHEQRSVGSGFVIHEDGYIVTNAHVVAAGAEMMVTFADGREHRARIVASDRERDLAVLKIDADRPLKPIPLGRSDDLMIAEQTIAIGNPVGLQNTVTTGVISALHRDLRVDEGTVYRDVIQTDASINPGNSGGPLLNVLGELIGVTTAIRGDAQNIGFAIPVNQLREVLPEMFASEAERKAIAGMRVSIDDPPRVVQIAEGSPADVAGIRLGDRLRTVDGRSIRGGLDYYVGLLARRAGETLNLGLERGADSVEVQLALTPVPKPDGIRLAREKLGIELANLTEAQTQSLNLPSRSGVIVVRVESRSPAARIDIRPGDMLVFLGTHRVEDVDHVGRLLQHVRRDDPIDIVLWRVTRRQIYHLEGRLYAR